MFRFEKNEVWQFHTLHVSKHRETTNGDMKKICLANY